MDKLNETIIDVIVNSKVTEVSNDGDWQSKCRTAIERSSHLLRTGSLSDCKFVVGQQSYRAHKLILASASREFENMFYGESAETKEVYHITDIQPEPFKAMLDYIYTDVISVQKFDEAVKLYCCANKYKLKHLSKSIINFLTVNLKPETALHIYEVAEMINEYELKTKSLETIHEHATDILKSVSFLKAKLTTVVKIFSLPILNFNNEVELFKAAERYANAVGELKPDVNTSRKRKLPPNESITQTRDVDVEEMDAEKNEASTSKSISETKCNAAVIDDKKKEVFRKIIPNILFLSMKPRQFAEKISQSPYLTDSEKYALLNNIVSDKTNVPVPDGFNRQRFPRFQLITDPECYTDISATKEPGRTEAVFRLTVSKFKNVKQISLPFYVRNMKWRVAVNSYVNPCTNINISNKNVLDIHLTTHLHQTKITCAAKVTIWVEKWVKRQQNNNSTAEFSRILKETDHVFSSKSSTIGCTLPLTDFIFDLNSTYKIYVDIKTGEMSGN